MGNFKKKMSESKAQKRTKNGSKRKYRSSGIAKTPSSYLLFAMDARKDIIEKDPTLKLGDVSKECGKLWKEISADDKEEWKNKANLLKEEARSSHPVVVKKEKRVPSSYILFAMSERKRIVDENPDMKLGDISKMCGTLWKGLSETEKEHWKNKANDLRTEKKGVQNDASV